MIEKIDKCINIIETYKFKKSHYIILFQKFQKKNNIVIAILSFMNLLILWIKIKKSG